MDAGYPAKLDTLESGSVGHDVSSVCTRNIPDIEFDIHMDVDYPANPDTLESGSVGYEASLVGTRDRPDIEFDIHTDAGYPANTDTLERGSVGHDASLVCPWFVLGIDRILSLISIRMPDIRQTRILLKVGRWFMKLL